VAQAQELPYPGATIVRDANFTPYPLVIQGNNAGLAFDLGGSEKRKLQLQLAEPLNLEPVPGAPGKGGLVMTGTGLNLPINSRLALGAGAMVGHGITHFQAVGSIHCEDGTLDAVSYRASKCYFVDGPGNVSAGTVNLGARYRPNESVSAGFNLFRSDSGFSSTYGTAMASRSGGATLDPATLSITPGNPLLSGLDPALGLQAMDSELTGIDLEFQVGISTDQAGDMVLGLQLTRVLDGHYRAEFFSTPGTQNWTIAEPVNSARLSFDWYKGPFSGGVQTYYREQVDFLGRPSLKPYGTFDVHFTWRAPWNASLSVGASNVLDAGNDEKAVQDNALSDPFESVYGRIPYVRYKQDL